ncbi:MAG: prepilin-type N-terminal cleavage/methylation domain-containing protein [Proteobacteria bacterium]|nr:prepilin-type N-terminal cleavage/methylation domain-containing protein [Pseudomonadota bacterium]MBU1688717.1 prepilin-type N-terminal cleavage/methylation domain-containing protein [Pseudomonadota bacterium]
MKIGWDSEEAGRAGPRRLRGVGQAGMTLFEMMIAMVMMVMVTSILYSVLNVGIKFSSKGEARIMADEQERSFLDLLHRQVQGAWYSLGEHRVMINSADEQLVMVTSQPLLNRTDGLVVAIYSYDDRDGTVYYTEKRDFYNETYYEDYQVDLDDMIVLLKNRKDFTMSFEDLTGTFEVTLEGRSHEFIPRSWRHNEDD